MATSIFFNGRLISVPGSYSEVDASGLETVGLGASGIVAVLGEAEGGRPAGTMTESKDFLRFTSPDQVLAAFRSGDLFEAGDFAFAPSSDPDVPAGAQEMVAMKVNPALQSAAVLSNGAGDAVDLQSLDYGAFTEQINVSIAPGTTQGKLITITFEDVVETEDDVGGDAMFSLTYDGNSAGWDTTALAQVTTGGKLTASLTLAQAGISADIANQLAAPAAVEAVSNNAGDTGILVVVGVDGSNNPLTEELQLNGTTPVVGTTTFTFVYGAYLKVGTAVGTITLDPAGGGLDVLVLTVGESSQGMKIQTTMFANSVLALVAGAASTEKVVLIGQSNTGANITETVILNGTTPVNTTNTWGRVDAIALGGVAGGTTVTFSGTLATTTATHTTVQKSADFFNARQDLSGNGFTFTIITGSTNFLMTDLDVQTATVDIESPTTASFYADLYAVVAWINANSQYISATVSAGAAGGAPSNTASPVFLSGGTEGTTAFSDWQNALNLLKKIRVNSVVVLTGDPAVHAALEAHCAYMGGIGRSERDAFAGALNAGLTDVPTKAEFKAQVVDLNSRHVRLVGQAIERFNRAGQRVEFLPPFTALVAAGMQAGSPVGTSLTYKLANVLSVRQDASWNPTDDAEELIQAGCLFMESVDGLGRRWVRNVTTHLSSNNLAFIEGSVNEAANFATFTFRTGMEFAVGKPGFAGTTNAAKGVGTNLLGLLTAAQVLTGYRSLAVDIALDVLEVSVEIAPIIPINFVKNTIHLVTSAAQVA